MKILFHVRTKVLFVVIVCWSLITISCSYKSNRQLQSQSSAYRYRTGFPSDNVSAELTSILTSVKRIINYSSYRTYIFDNDAKVTLKDLNSEGIHERTRAGIVTNEATEGSALIICSNGKNIVLLTCAHAVRAADTIIDWYEYSDLGNNRYIQSISIRFRQQLYVRDIPEGSKFRELASDTKNDIAFIGTEYTEPVNNIPFFKNKCGNSSDLEWGSFLYFVGYPTGQQMVTHGIVSTLPQKAGYFLTDALFNEGFSGGIALAVTESGGNFELVGMARSVAGNFGYMLKPEKENHEFTYNPAIPYTGNVYVNQKKDISYGVTSVVSINQIRQFYTENRTRLNDTGYNLDEFFGFNSK